MHIQKINISLTTAIRLFLIAMLLFQLLIPDIAFALQLPTEDANIVPETSADDSLFKKVGKLLLYFFYFLMICALGYGLVTSIFSIFAAVNDARSDQESWKSALTKIALNLAVIVFALLIFVLANKYVFNPLESIG